MGVFLVLFVIALAIIIVGLFKQNRGSTASGGIVHPPISSSWSNSNDDFITSAMSAHAVSDSFSSDNSGGRNDSSYDNSTNDSSSYDSSSYDSGSFDSGGSDSCSPDSTSSSSD